MLLSIAGGKMLRAALLGLVVIAAAQAAHAQAFGVRMGTPIADFSNAKVIEDKGAVKRYSVPSLPSPHSEFESYTLNATTRHGVCSVMGVGKDHTGDRSGYSIRLSYNELKAALTTKYGRGKEYDFLEGGALWDEPQDFAMALKQGERTLITFWSAENGSSLPNDLHAIMLSANATDSSTTYIKLTYEFANFEDCQAEQGKRDDRAL